MNMHKFSTQDATVWVSREDRVSVNYYYGGTRLVNHQATDEFALRRLDRLMKDESGIKNRLIDWCLNPVAGFTASLLAELPAGFVGSRVGGARCIIRPDSEGAKSALEDPLRPRSGVVLGRLLERLGEVLNADKTDIKLTPDFGRYAGVADKLFEYTDNVLGIACSSGGCGGKSSYTVSGVMRAVQVIAVSLPSHAPITCIGANGAMGGDIVERLRSTYGRDVAVCDLAFDGPQSASVPTGCLKLVAEEGRFTDECLLRGGLVVAATVGDELNCSNWRLIPSGTVILLAHNLSLPPGEEGAALARELAARGVLVIPGQVLTLGGALTARLEWFWRLHRPGEPFDKVLAHRVVRTVVGLVLYAILRVTSRELTPFEAMISLAKLTP
jgi:hypothetical protein